MGQHLGKREALPETKALSEPAHSTSDATESQDDVFGLNEPDVNQNKDHPSKSTGTAASAALHSKDRANPEDPGASGPRPHLARLFSRDAPGREDNTFKDRPSESDELHTIPEELPGTGAHSASENAEQDAD
ncbi:myelin basic protein-like [Electrophorus electricus]|uniref:Myelin basic protein n=1 Tax=Electrophorus electricus TaxID=8005 RepID=A0AAY5E9D9_ELEEL|nr:myelin basic protein-like [Electrophorus electricus]